MATTPLPATGDPPGAQPAPADSTPSPDSQLADAPSPPTGDAEDDASFSVAEDVSLPPQWAQARRAGQAPDGEARPGATTAPDAMAESLPNPDAPD